MLKTVMRGLLLVASLYRDLPVTCCAPSHSVQYTIHTLHTGPTYCLSGPPDEALAWPNVNRLLALVSCTYKPALMETAATENFGYCSTYIRLYACSECDAEHVSSSHLVDQVHCLCEGHLSKACDVVVVQLQLLHSTLGVGLQSLGAKRKGGGHESNGPPLVGRKRKGQSSCEQAPFDSSTHLLLVTYDTTCATVLFPWHTLP